MDDEEAGVEVELTDLGRHKDGSANEVESYRPAVRRQNFCFGFGLLSCLAALIVAGVYVSPSFSVGEVGVNEYDSGSGEVGLDADNAKTQGIMDEEFQAAMKKRHWGKNGGNMNWWNPGHMGGNHAGKGKDWVRNFTYWDDNPNFDKDKLAKLQNFYNRRNRTWTSGITFGEDGTCNRNGRRVPCPKPNPHGESNNVQDEKDGQSQEGDKALSYTEITLQDGKQFEILEKLPHDKSSFTQGLTYANGKLFESTGLYGKSKVRQLNPETGEVMMSKDMSGRYFGEGMTYYDENKLIQITWKRQKGFIYDSESLEVMKEFEFTTTKNEGWGITFDPNDRTFIVSDGSSFLHFWDADNPGVDKANRPKVQVMRQSGKPARNLNELEFVNGKVIANVWFSDVLLVIEPKTGTCEKEYDFSSLWPGKERKGEGADVLNGVSVSGDEGVFFVTGKLWNRLYKIKLFGMDDAEESG